MISHRTSAEVKTQLVENLIWIIRLHKLDNTMKKGEEYNDFITGLDDTDRYKELKYIWTEKLYPEMNNLYDNIKEKKPEPNDPSSTYDASKFFYI